MQIIQRPDEKSSSVQPPAGERGRRVGEFWWRCWKSFQHWWQSCWRLLRKMKASDRLMASFTFVVALCACLQIWILGCQISDSRKATQAATRTQILTELPLIVPINPRMEWNNKIPAGGVFIRENFKNIGETRAVAPDIYVGWGNELPNSSTSYIHFGSLIKWTWPKGESIVGAMCVTLPEAKTLEKQVTNHSAPLYFYTKIRYTDLFPSDKEAGHPRNDHLVETCLKIDHIEVDEKDRGARTTWGGDYCPERLDCIDESCGEDYQTSTVKSRSPTSPNPRVYPHIAAV